jgi:hypothetical protein
MVTSILNERVAAPPPGLPEDQHHFGGNCELVDRIALVDGAHDYMVIRSANGSEIILGPWRLTGMGDCVTSARVSMAAGTHWQVEKIRSDSTEAYFLRDAEVAVGEPFSIVLSPSSERRHLRINLARVTAISVCHE